MHWDSSAFGDDTGTESTACYFSRTHVLCTPKNAVPVTLGAST